MINIMLTSTPSSPNDGADRIQSLTLILPSLISVKRDTGKQLTFILQSSASFNACLSISKIDFSNMIIRPHFSEINIFYQNAGFSTFYLIIFVHNCWIIQSFSLFFAKINSRIVIFLRAQHLILRICFRKTKITGFSEKWKLAFSHVDFSRVMEI